MNSEMCHVLWVVRRIVILDGLVENFFPWRSALIKLKECSLSMWKLLTLYICKNKTFSSTSSLPLPSYAEDMKLLYAQLPTINAWIHVQYHHISYFLGQCEKSQRIKKKNK